MHDTLFPLLRTPEQKSSLRGKRYNLEKKPVGHPEQSHTNDAIAGSTSERLAQQYGVSPITIQKDGAFASAVDTLEAEVRQDIRATVLRRQERGKGKATKARATMAGKLIAASQVAAYPFMRRVEWCCTTSRCAGYNSDTLWGTPAPAQEVL